MDVMIIGLVLFLAPHSVRIYAPGLRERAIERLGLNLWKALYALVSGAGLALIVWGFGLARAHPTVLYVPAGWLRHLNALLTLIAFVLFAAAYVPRNHLKAAIGHPMLAGVKIWALGHLLATGMLHDVVLFGAFLVWAAADFAVLRRRDRRTGTAYPPGSAAGDVVTVLAGAVAWAVFAFWLHAALIGVNPFG